MRSIKHISIENNREKKENNIGLIKERYKPGIAIKIVDMDKNGITLDDEAFFQMIQDIQYLLEFYSCDKTAEVCQPLRTSDASGRYVYAYPSEGPVERIPVETNSL